eukprot:gnl/TRDRNA2_/TRDRNA2_59885_c0_seq1.p1 gnl/TRDRNA2_/TRDRNA2_59885_c0~~gnl/TRDRNA2_/TRDRNA2_59885_c0_seq1.p1  ORF type:complete len:501 (-),score=116.13 gnl/TRDRNA2_/TRDRNA2_59885_c0_seq1:36-1538(-)
MSGNARRKRGEGQGAEAAEAPVPASSPKKRRAQKAAEVSASEGPASELREEDFLDAECDDEEEEEEVVDEDEEPEEEEDDDDDEFADAAKTGKAVYRPGVDALEEGEQLDVVPGTYDLLHRAQVDWPCLSFDVMRDSLGAQRSTYPMTAYVVAGSQAEKVEDNRIWVMKWSKLYKTAKDGCEDSEDDDSDDDDEHGEAQLDYKSVTHPGAVNRIRSMHQAPHIVATWSDAGAVHMWNLDGHRKALDKPGEKPNPNLKPLYSCKAHKEEGFAMDFSPHDTGKFLSGANSSEVFLWEPVPGGWKVGSDAPFSGHKGSVEDVQWKRQGNGMNSTFASCSSDRSLRVWDIREESRKKSAINISEAHSEDVNVLSWSPIVGDLIVSGADDGSFKIWDMRQVQAGPMANFHWHKKPITSVDWHPTDETTLGVACADDSVSIWDMAVEDDAIGRPNEPSGADHYPSQLLFLHQGQKEPKEIRWHPQIPGVCISTALTGFNVFKTCNI